MWSFNSYKFAANCCKGLIPIVLAGHSLGGSASIMVSRKDPAILACVNLDGEGDKKPEGLKKPLLMIFSDHLKDQHKGSKKEQQMFQAWKTCQYEPILKNWKALQDNSKHARVVKIEGIAPRDFNALPFLNLLRGEGNAAAGLKAHKTTSEEILRFMHSLNS